MGDNKAFVFILLITVSAGLLGSYFESKNRTAEKLKEQETYILNRTDSLCKDYKRVMDSCISLSKWYKDSALRKYGEVKKINDSLKQVIKSQKEFCYD